MTTAIERWPWTLVVGATFGSFAAGTAIAVSSPTPHVVGAAICALVALPILIMAVAAVADTTYAGAGVLVAIGGLSAIVVHRSPNVTLLELLLLGGSAVVVPARLLTLRLAAKSRQFVRLFLYASGGLLLLGAVSVLRPVAAGTSSAAVGELIKNASIFAIAAGALCFADTLARFKLLYGLLLTIWLVSMTQTVVSTGGHLLSRESLQTGVPLWAFTLTLPFVRSRAVALVAMASFALLVLARTRSAWLELLVVALVVVARGRFRRSLGVRSTRLIAAAAVAMVVLVVLLPGLFMRLSSITAGNDQSLHDRFAMDQAALIALREQPLTGVGPGAFKVWLLSSPNTVHFDIGVEKIPRDPHDAFAKFAAELGWPGLLLFAAWAVSVLGVPWRLRRDALVPGPLRPYGVGLMLFAILFLFDLTTDEWGSFGRLEIAISAGALLALSRVAPVRGRTMMEVL